MSLCQSLSVVKQGKIIVLSASSGAGKTTLMRALYDYFKDKYPLHRVVTYTTRMPRQGEKKGVDYHFLSQDQFEKKIQEGFFIEWSCAYGAYYGSPVHILDDCKKGISSLLILDRQGVCKLLALCPERIISLWLTTDNQVLQERLKQRGSETRESFDSRMQLAQKEGQLEKVDPIFTYHVQNDDFVLVLGRLIEIITQELEITR